MCIYRGKTLEYADVLCYRDYTREGKRVNTHSLVIKNVKLLDFKVENGMLKHDHEGS